MSTAGTISLPFVPYLAICAVVASLLVIPSSGYRNCSSQNDCRNDDSCCAGRCVYDIDCLGRSCSDDTECRTVESCCDGTCSYSCFTSDGHVGSREVLAYVVMFLVICIFVGVVICCCLYACHKCPSCVYAYDGIRRDVLRPTVAAATTTGSNTTRCATQTNTPYQYQGQSPPSYQQGHLHNSPPQYVQYPPYNAGSTNSSDPPPPYSGSEEGSSGGGSTNASEPPPPYSDAEEGSSGGGSTNPSEPPPPYSGAEEGSSGGGSTNSSEPPPPYSDAEEGSAGGVYTTYL